MRYLIIISILFITAFAHPHAFIDVYLKLKNSSKSVQTLEFKWVIDEMTSSMLMMDLDTNQNGKVEKDENTQIKKFYFDSLAEYNYYTHILNGDRKIPINPKKFKTGITKDGRIYHTFEVTLSVKSLKDIKIDFYDEDFVVAMMIKDSFINLIYKHKITEIENDFFFGYRLSFS